MIPCTPPPPPRHRHAGFTLLEILVVMVVLAMIVTTAFGALRLGERSWEAGHARAGENERLRTVAGLLQRQFSQILPLTWMQDGQQSIAFSGAHDRIRFIAPAPQHQGATGLFEFTLAVEPRENGARLVLDYRLHDPDKAGFRPEGSERDRVLLVEDLKSARFEYYGTPEAKKPPQWHPQWNDDAEAFPRLVRARLVARDAGRPWPELSLVLPVELAP